MNIATFWLPILLLASLRLAHLVMDDKILDVPRNWVLGRSRARAERRTAAQDPTDPEWAPARPWLAVLLGCIRCVSIWTSALVAGGAYLFGEAWLWVMLPFAVSAAVSMLDSLVERY